VQRVRAERISVAGREVDGHHQRDLQPTGHKLRRARTQEDKRQISQSVLSGQVDNNRSHGASIGAHMKCVVVENRTGS
jgi:hypothetical protein